MAAVSSARTGAIPGRPLNVVDLIDAAFTALRFAPGTIVLSILWIVIPMSLLEGWLSRSLLGGSSLVGALNDPTLLAEAAEGPGAGTTIGTYLVDWSRTSVIGLAVAFLLSNWATDHRPAPMEVVRATVGLLPTWAASFVMAKVLVGLGSILVIPGLAFILGFAMVSPVLMIERVGPIAALRRSFRLMRRRPAQVAGLYLGGAFVGSLVANAITLIPAGVALVIGTDLGWPLVTAASIVSTSLLAPFYGAAMTLMYFDICYRTEGLDIRLRTDEVFGREAVLDVG